MSLSRAVAGVIVMAASLAVAPPAAAAPDGCPDVEVIFARGTGEPAGVGNIGQAFIEALAPRLGGRTLNVYPVNYPASFDFLEAAEGAEDAAARIVEVSSRCPDTRIVVGGYSQGAALVDMLAQVHPLGGAIGDIGSAPPLAAPFADAVSAVAVFGNPAARFSTPLSQAGFFVGKAIDLCNPEDPICSATGEEMAAHTSYESAPYPEDSAGFVAERLG